MKNYTFLFSLLLLFVVSDLDAQRRSGRASKRIDETKKVENVKSDELHKKYGFSSRDHMVEFLLGKDLKRSDKRIVEKYGKGKKLSKSQSRKFEALLKEHAKNRAVSKSGGRSGRVSGDRALSSRGSSTSRAKSRGRSGRHTADMDMDMDMMDHDSTMTPVMHLLGGLDGFLNDKAADNKLDSDQVQPMMELANNLEAATHSEWESDNNSGAAGAAMEAAEQYLNDNNIEQGVRDHFMQMLCMLEWEVHAEHQDGPPEEGPDCGMEMEHDWYCQICDMHFDSGEAMDDHAAQMGHTDVDFDCDPNHDYPQMDPGPDGGCADYADCNGNGAFDLGEPCYEGHDQGGPSFEEVDANSNGSISRDEARAFFGDEDDFDAQFDEVDSNNNDSVNMDEWEDAMADDSNEDHGDGDTYWADEAFQLQGSQGHYDRVMGVAEEDREHEYNMVKNELGMGDEDMDPPMEHDWYCQICDMHFDSGEAMDNHAAQMGHTDTDFDCDPNHDYPQMDPGPDGGCADYADCNGNGVFDVGEPCYEGDGYDGPPPFEEVDANGDGNISRDEARAFFGNEDGFDEEFDNIDTDNNGSVDPQEYADADGGDSGHNDGQ